MLKSEPNLA
jgi:serine/threonine-protein phosphatase 2B catalytic subunit